MAFRKEVYNMFFSKAAAPELSKEHLEAADRAFIDACASESLRNVLFVVFGHLLYAPFYMSFNTNLIPILVNTIMGLSNLMGFVVGFRLWKKGATKAFNLMLAVQFVVQHIALVLSEKWVQKVFYFKVGSFFRDLREEPLCGGYNSCKLKQDAPGPTECYMRVDVDQLWIILVLELYFILMILPARYGILFLPSLVIYVGIVMLLGGRFAGGGWATIIAITFTNLVCIWNKYRKELTSCMLFRALQNQQKQTIDEKVKRCEAEFKSDLLQDNIKTTSFAGATASSNPAGNLSVSSGSNAKCPTHYSAPAACPIINLDRWSETACSNNDCLLGTSQVYVEGLSNALRELQHLEEGQRVLSVDDLTGCFEFVEVSSIQASTCPDRVTRIVLEDDSVIDLTSDHPMPVFDSTLSDTLPKFLPAGCLVPQAHSLSTWKRCKLKIKQVSTVQPVEQVQVLAVNASHPERYKLLVTGPKDQAHTSDVPSMTAVGFANLGLANFTRRSSFLDVADMLQSGQVLRRSNSDPCLHRSRLRDDDPSGKDDFAQPYSEKPYNWQVNRNGTSVNASRVDANEVEQEIPLSVGSIGHRQGNCCRPCNFHQRWLAGRSWGPCSQGVACNFCHEPHDRSAHNLLKRQARRRRDHERRTRHPEHAADLVNGNEPETRSAIAQEPDGM